MFNAPFIGRRLSPIIFGNSGQGGSTPPPDPLLPYYVSGTIGIHFATDAVTTNASGQVTALHNKGSLGPLFDATVSGAPIALSSNALNMTSTSGIITTANPAALSGVRLMFVVGVDQIVNGMRFFGHVNGALTWDLIANTNASGMLVQGRYLDGAITTLSGSPRVMTAATGFCLIEVEFSATQWLTWINGTAATGANASVPEFYISTVGTGASGARFLGLMGDVAGVLTGRADTAAAIAAVKAVFNQKFGTPV